MRASRRKKKVKETLRERVEGQRKSEGEKEKKKDKESLRETMALWNVQRANR